MKIRDLRRKTGQTTLPVWPVRSWTSSYGPGDKFATGEEGVLKSVKRMGDHLSLTMEYEKRQHFGSLQWDPPPSLDAMEKVLGGQHRAAD